MVSAPHGPSRRTNTSAQTEMDCRRRAALLPRRTHRLACGLAPARLFALQHRVGFWAWGQHIWLAACEFSGGRCAKLINYSPVCMRVPLRRAEARSARKAQTANANIRAFSASD